MLENVIKRYELFLRCAFTCLRVCVCVYACVLSHVCRVRWRLMLWQQVWHVFQAQTCRGERDREREKGGRKQIGVRVYL